MNWFIKKIILYSSWIVIFGFLLAFSSGYYTLQLYKNLRTDVEELLPANARSVQDLNEVTERLESIDNISVLVFSEDGKASRQFVEDLAHRLETYPKDVIAWVEYRINKEIDFFQKRQALYLSVEDLKEVKKYIKNKIEYETLLYNPLNIISKEELPEPVLNFYRIRKKYEQQVEHYLQFPDGYYASQDEKIRILLAYLPGKVSGIQGALRLKKALDESVKALNPKSYAADLHVEYSGGVQNLIEERAALFDDLTVTTVIVLVLVTLVLLIYFRSFGATFCLVLSLFAGTLWTLGLSFFLIGYLNANSAFLGSIVLGNGINYGIILLARYLEERRNWKGHIRALHIAMEKTFSATLTATLAAGLSYGSLILTDFRGFRQFGLIGFLGMLICWGSAYTFLPAFMTIYNRYFPIIPSKKLNSRRLFSYWVAYIVRRFPKQILILSLLISLGSLVAFKNLNSEVIESDLMKLRSKQSIESGSVYWSKYTDEVFQRYMTPLVFLPKTEEQAQKVFQLLVQKKEEEGNKSLVDIISFLDQFVPKNQAEKRKIFDEIEDLLTPLVRRSMSVNDKTLVAKYLNPEVYQEIKREGLPDLLLKKFREKDGTLGKLVLVEPPITNEIRNSGRLIQFIGELRLIADQVAPGMPVAGQLAVSTDLIQAIRKDGPRATLFALCSVVLLVIVLFRQRKMIFLVLGALFIGVLWIVGFILMFDLKINFLNFIALPMTFGIGVDYSVNLFQRYRTDGEKDILKAIRETGGAVMLASLTTIIGYGSLILASNQAFVSFGIFSVIGEFTCIISSLLTIPAFILLRQNRVRKNLNEVASGSSSSTELN